MATKTHCDVCDAVGATDAAAKQAPVPGKPLYMRDRLLVTVYVTSVSAHRHDRDDDEPLSGARKDVCDACRAKLVADAFGLKTAEEYHELLDRLGRAERVAGALGLRPGDVGGGARRRAGGRHRHPVLRQG
jgi:hypothetical protein